MPLFSDEIIEEVRSANDIVDVISEYVPLKKKGSDYAGLCPFHNEKSPSFYVSPDTQLYYCFGCGAGGTVFTFLMQYENYSFPEAMQVLAKRAGIELPQQEMNSRQRRAADRRSRLLEINKEAAKYYFHLLYSPRGRQALEYFHKRELSDETIRHFGLGYSDKYSNDLYQYLKRKGYPDEMLKDSGLVTFRDGRGPADKFWNRAMFPIMDANSRVIGFGGRVMGDGQPKYLNSPETDIFDKSRNLYGLNFARRSRRPQMLLCEGYMDVIALHQAGFTNAVASLGTSFTSGHAGLLKRYTNEVYLTFDSDGAGIKAALRAIPILKEAGLTAKVISMKPHKDPDEFIKALGADSYQQRIDQAENSFLFEVRMLEQSFDLQDPESRTAFFRQVSDRILTFEDNLERDNYIRAVAQRYQIRYEDLRDMVRSEGVQDGIVRRRKPLRSGIHRKEKEREDGYQKMQRLLLAWMTELPELFDTVGNYITTEDFTDPLYRTIAEMLLEQYRQGKIEPARIINHFEEEEQQRKAAAVFHERAALVDTRPEREKAVREIVYRMKSSSIERKRKELDPSDVNGYQEILKEKRQLEEIRREKFLS